MKNRWSVLLLICAAFGGMTAFAHSGSSNDALEQLFDSVLHLDDVTEITCIDQFSLVPRIEHPEVHHDLVIHYFQDGHKLVKVYPDYLVTSNNESWGPAAFNVFEGIESDSAFRERSCQVANTIAGRLRRFRRRYIGAGEPSVQPVTYTAEPETAVTQ